MAFPKKLGTPFFIIFIVCPIYFLDFWAGFCVNLMHFCAKQTRFDGFVAHLILHFFVFLICHPWLHECSWQSPDVSDRFWESLDEREYFAFRVAQGIFRQSR